jgi:hypothetical protein
MTPRRLKALTVTAMVIAGLVSTVGVSGSTSTAHAGQAGATAHHAGTAPSLVTPG